MTTTISTFIGALIVAAGIPSAIFGFFIRRVEKKLDAAENDRKERADVRLNHEVMLIEMTLASLELAEVTAEAVQRIPDANCNGEMAHALKAAKEMRNKYHNFEHVQVVSSLEKGAK